MNKSVLRTAIVVIICTLLAEYILKFFVPEEFVLVVSNPNLIKAGTFINSHRALYYIVSSFFSYTTYYLFTCACGHTKYLSWKLSVLIVPIIAIAHVITYYIPQCSTQFLVCSMIMLAYLNKSDLKSFMIVFCVHTVAQSLSLEIRGLSLYIVSFDVLSCFMLTIECYLWLLLFYILYSYNIKEKEVKN